MRLLAREPFVIPDPRCVQSIEERVLRLLGARPATSSEEIAHELRVSIRTAQTAIKQLLADGVCQPRRSGRNIVYQIEDTTFSEPTPVGQSIG